MRTMTRVFATLTLFWGSRVGAIPVEGHKILISAPNAQAVEVGRKVAAQGGNVVDVAVAVGLSLSVTAPYYASLGGGGFALVKMNQVVEAIDFREVAPQATSRDYFLNLPKGASQSGGHAVSVPGVPAGLWALHQKFGKLKWAQLFKEPLAQAQKGFQVSGDWVDNTQSEKERFNAPAIKALFRAGGLPLKPGETLKQPGLAKALLALRDKNARGFYEGPVAQDIVRAVTLAGGKMTSADLKAYKVRWLSPITTDYEGYKLHLMPPPSSGGVLIQSALKLIDKLKVKELPALSSEEYHLLAEIQARVFRGRFFLGDPDFYKNPLNFLTSEKYLNELAESVNRNKTVALKPLSVEEIKESPETTHFSVLDNEGHAVALTVTLNGNYGSALLSEQYGIALNNQMDDFTTHPGEPNMYKLIQGPGNEVEPGKRPLSSMSPTLVEKHGKIVMAIGAPGGPRIISSVLQTLYRILGRGTDIDLAVQAPRVHHQFLPNVLFIDRERFSPDVIDALKARGHAVESGWMGKVFVVRLRPDGILEGAFDSRGEGAVGGM